MEGKWKTPPPNKKVKTMVKRDKITIHEVGFGDEVAKEASNPKRGDPTFLEPFWIANAEAGVTVVPAWYRMSYDVNNALEYSATSPELEKQIRALHEVVGNAVTKGRYIVLGTGSTQLINAAVYSLSQAHARNPSKVVAAIPYYGPYRYQTEMFDSNDYVWKGDARVWVKKSGFLNSSTFIEFVTSPNNPDGLLKKGVLTSKNVKDIYDHAYYWPHYTGIPRPASEDIMLFTLSKVTGHAGSRLGWAIVEDYDVYERMYDYVEENTLGVSHDTQLRTTILLKAIVNGYKQKNGSHRFSLQSLEPRYCTFFKKVTGPSPAYAWVKCEKEEETDCTGVLRKAGIIGRNASVFEADKRYVRLSLLKRDDNFALLERRLQALVS
ncbi:hypothetical protein SUGI_0527040 [Cryptomeria japonica]|nr:hypothetical protein SUGI_0527040 [Cryptomeria japonica]